ncbi:peptidyl-prolyl cis-trans isomerase FKBP16-3, chloroplastic [Andrographis paniculata]|uniref:peptidyl-prolyl cis-trans isomerase FKBP16-3, chloroplastic n=1 Tax=Andrographis paniculata TaxID=175694 RepID=UPI0021E7E778|nr:peptidyl-prolyl cis-trans isomerase FKBP16-3, chloroplastic [Andrographis paniculata]
MASPSLLLPLGCTFGKEGSYSRRDCKIHVRVGLNSLASKNRLQELKTIERQDACNCMSRRKLVASGLGFLSLLGSSNSIEAAGLPPEDKPKLCDDACEKELENVPMVTTDSGLQYKDIKVGGGPSPPVGFQVAANYVAMVPSGQIFDSSLEKGQLYIFRVGAGQVIKGLDEGILSMKAGGKRRLYIPGPLAFPKGLTSAPGRPRVAPNSPVIFDVSLEYIPGMEAEEE